MVVDVLDVVVLAGAVVEVVVVEAAVSATFTALVVDPQAVSTRAPASVAARVVRLIPHLRVPRRPRRWPSARRLRRSRWPFVPFGARPGVGGDRALGESSTAAGSEQDPF
jgi:hypothetical protein